MNPDGREMRRHERELAAAIVAAFARLRRDLLRDANADNVQQLANRRLRDPTYWQPLEDAIVPEMRKIAEAGATFGQRVVERTILGTVKAEPLEIAGINWDLANEWAAEWAIQFGRTLAGELAKTTTPRIQSLISAWILDGRAFYELTRDIADGYFYSEARANTIAVTEVTRAYAEGNMAAWRESRVINGRRWNTANDELVCPVCGPLAGQIKPLGESFGLIDNPPAHPRCRCWITPEVIRDDQD